jgi:energy-coupling factor transporter ATP-binding protein EcfA2
MMSGLLKPSSGLISVNGLDSIRHSREVRKMVGMVFQDPDSQIVGETVREDVSFGPENLGLASKEIHERVVWALDKMGLTDLSEKPCYLLSGGEKRRLAIARVMAMLPQVVLFDEPFANLDYPAVRVTLQFMIQLHQEGHTVIVTTHDVEKVIAHVDRIAILQGGEIKIAGQPEVLVEELLHFGIRPPCYVLLGEKKLSWLE